MDITNGSVAKQRAVQKLLKPHLSRASVVFVFNSSDSHQLNSGFEEGMIRFPHLASDTVVQIEEVDYLWQVFGL